MKYMYLPPQHLHRWVQFSATENSVFRTFEEIFQNALSAKTQEIGAENIHSGILVTFDNYPQANANEQNCQSYCFLLPFPKGQSSLRYTANTFICKCWNWTIQLCCWDWTLLYFYILGRYWVLPFPHSNDRQEKNIQCYCNILLSVHPLINYNNQGSVLYTLYSPSHCSLLTFKVFMGVFVKT